MDPDDDTASVPPDDGGRTASLGTPKKNTAEATIGSVIAGKYRLERVLGRGGMGVVYEATNLAMRSKVAHKLVSAPSSEAGARMVREARLAAAIDDPHVGRVLDVGVEDAIPYVVMDRLEGETLADVLKARGPLPWEEALAWLAEACEGLAAAHARGIVHRDLKPSNMFLARSARGVPPVLKILDFGIAKDLGGAAGEDTGGLTATNAVLGSPFYMPPEQVRSARDVDERADVWAMGITFYELLSGKPPFVADTTPGVLAAVIADTPKPLANVPASVARVVARCLQKNPGQRFADARALREALEHARARANSGRGRTIAVGVAFASLLAMGIHFGLVRAPSAAEKVARPDPSVAPVAASVTGAEPAPVVLGSATAQASSDAPKSSSPSMAALAPSRAHPAPKATPSSAPSAAPTALVGATPPASTRADVKAETADRK